MAHRNQSKSAALRPRFRSVLFICAANTARSVIAEHLLRRALDTLGADGKVRVRSAGIAPYARDGALVSMDTRFTLRDVGIELGDEATSTDLKRHPELLDEAEVVIAMTAQQQADLLAKFPAARQKPVFTLRAFAGEDGDIEDPVEKGDAVFTEVREEITRLMPALIERLFHGAQGS